MSIYTKGAVSAAALLMAVSFAQAQSGDRPEQRPQGGAQQGEQRGGGDNRPEQRPQGAQQGERGGDNRPDGGSERGQRKEGGNDGRAQGPQEKRDERGAQDRGDRDGRPGGNASDRRDGGQDRSEGKQERRKFSVSADKRPRFRDAIKRNSNVKRYRRADVRFSINLGTRIPDTFVFYDAPSEFYDIDPEFRRYKIIVLDDVLLIVDPDTREIVDVIEI